MKKIETKNYSKTAPAPEDYDLPGMIQDTIGSNLSPGECDKSSLAMHPELKIDTTADVVGWKQGINFAISQREVEDYDITRLHHQLRPEAGNPIFSAGPGRVTFTFEGYSEDMCNLLLISELQTYIREADQAGLCWMYFADPETKWLLFVLAVTGPQCSVIDHGNGLMQISLDQGDKFTFLVNQLQAYRMFCGRAGIDVEIANAHFRNSIKHSFDGVMPPYLANL